jgi:hypothetical protein
MDSKVQHASTQGKHMTSEEQRMQEKIEFLKKTNEIYSEALEAEAKMRSEMMRMIHQQRLQIVELQNELDKK